ESRRAPLCVFFTFALGATFLGIKAWEYAGKFEHQILPGYIGEQVEGPADEDRLTRTYPREKALHATSMIYVERVKAGLAKFTKGVNEDNLAGQSEAVKA